MKNLFLFSTILLTYTSINAQITVSGVNTIEFNQQYQSLTHRLTHGSGGWERSFNIGVGTDNDKNNNDYVGFGALGSKNGSEGNITYAYIDATGNPFYANAKNFKIYPNGSVSVDASIDGSSAYKFGNNYGQIYYDSETSGETNRGIYFQEQLSDQRGFHFLNSNGNEIVKFNGNGSVGIGTSTPLAGLEIANSDATGRTLKVTQQNNSISNNSYTLEVDSSIHNTNVSSAGAMAVDVNSGRAFTINGFGNVGIGTSNPNNGKLVVLQTQNINQGGIVIKANSTLQSTYLWMDSNNIMHIDNANNASRNIVFNGNGSGNVGIGTTTLDTGYKLTVKGNVSSREVRVTATAGGADFVFEDDYNLPSLETVENFIKDKKHLPEIPSAKEMEENGINLAEMNIKLLQKVEELTLYIIEQEKRINAQEKSIKALESKLEKKE